MKPPHSSNLDSKARHAPAFAIRYDWFIRDMIFGMDFEKMSFFEKYNSKLRAYMYMYTYVCMCVYAYICVHVCILWVAMAIWLIPQRWLTPLKILHLWNPPDGGFRSAHRNTQIPRCKIILDEHLIRICTARYWGVWLSRFGGFRGCSIFSGKKTFAIKSKLQNDCFCNQIQTIKWLQSNPNHQSIAFAIKSK